MPPSSNEHPSPVLRPPGRRKRQRPRRGGGAETSCDHDTSSGSSKISAQQAALFVGIFVFSLGALLQQGHLGRFLTDLDSARRKGMVYQKDFGSSNITRTSNHTTSNHSHTIDLMKENNNNVQQSQQDVETTIIPTTTNVSTNSYKEISGSLSDNVAYNNSFSACLMVMDDNHRLPEWLAYHYHVLPLRYLVVAVDPASKSSPTSVFDWWRQNMNMTIVEWSDVNYTSPALYSSLQRSATDTVDEKRRKYIERQKTFYLACTKHLQQNNRSWTAYYDIDEFMTMTPPGVPKQFQTIGDDGVAIPKFTLQQPGVIWKFLQEMRSHNDSVAFPFSHYQLTACITIPRASYGAVESTEAEVYQQVPEGVVDPHQLDTLRYRYRASKRGAAGDGLAKSIMDVSRLVATDYDMGASPHKALRAVCQTTLEMHYDHFPMGLHHYLSSWNTYSYRDDAAKGGQHSRQVWLERSVLQAGGPDDDARLWLQGLVDTHGPALVQEMLRHAGLPKNYTQSEEQLQEWMVDSSS